MFETITVPLDGSRFAELALPWAAEIASAFGSAVTLLSVSESETEEARTMRLGYLEHRAEFLRKDIAGRKAPLQTAIRTLLLAGEPAVSILRYTREQMPSLLFLVSHGHSGIMPWAMGSTAARVLSRVECPVLFIRAHKETATPPSLVQHILAALDGSPRGEAVLPHLKALAESLGSRITLFRAISPSHEAVTIGGSTIIQRPKVELDRLREEAHTYLHSLATAFPEGKATDAVVLGDPAPAILEFAGRSQVSLIAITTRGKADADWRFGEVSHKLVQSSVTPLLLVVNPGASG